MGTGILEEEASTIFAFLFSSGPFLFKCNEVFVNMPARKPRNPISDRNVCMTLLLGLRLYLMKVIYVWVRGEIPCDIQNWSACG